MSPHALMNIGDVANWRCAVVESNVREEPYRAVNDHAGQPRVLVGT